MKYLLILCLLSQPVFADSKQYSPCENALNACDQLVHDQDKAIQDLKLIKNTLENQLVDEQNSHIIPWYVYVGLGLIGGIVFDRKVLQ